MKQIKMFIVGVFAFLFTGCDIPPTVSPALEMTSCALTDERLSVAFKDPARARAYLRKLKRHLKDKDPEAIKEAADLIARFVECLPSE